MVAWYFMIMTTRLDVMKTRKNCQTLTKRIKFNDRHVVENRLIDLPLGYACKFLPNTVAQFLYERWYWNLSESTASLVHLRIEINTFCSTTLDALNFTRRLLLWNLHNFHHLAQLAIIRIAGISDVGGNLNVFWAHTTFHLKVAIALQLRWLPYKFSLYN